MGFMVDRFVLNTLQLSALLFPVLSFAQTTADYYVITDPQRYTIYDQYQQPLSASEKMFFVPYSPLRIMEPDVMLGDQITHALKFDFRQQLYYLLKDDERKFSGEKSNAGRAVYRHCEVVEDTVDVVGSGLVLLSGSGKSIAVGRGARLCRIFKSGSRYYIATVNERPDYGWSPLEPRSAWRTGRKVSSPASAGSDNGLSETLKERIMVRIASANESYKTYFSRFNAFTHDEKAVPVWRCEYGGCRMRCELSGPYKNSEQLSESSKYLAQEIENILVGTDFGVVCKNGEMVIEKRAGSK
jgi:hypothetical protein